MYSNQKTPSPLYDFDSTIPRQVLEAYLSRSLTMSHLLQGSGCPEDNLRMIENIKPKFLGRTLFLWGEENQLATSLEIANRYAQDIHHLDQQIILQAGIFEIVTNEVENIIIPEWVFESFDLPSEKRCFSYPAMLFSDGTYVNHWGKGKSVPDVTKIETQMWIFYLAGVYLEIGIESLHIGQVMLMGRSDPALASWDRLLNLIRGYAQRNARRHLALFDAHVSSGVGCYGLSDDPALAPGGFRVGNRLLLDFHALPLRIKEITCQPLKAELAVGHLDALYGRSLGGITPSGWECGSLPFLVEFDNWGSSGHGGESVVGKIGDIQGISDRYWVWGWDEICWFAHLPEDERNDWLWYAWEWVHNHDPNGFLELPGLRGLADPVGGVKEYSANTSSPACPSGFNQENTIKAIWQS